MVSFVLITISILSILYLLRLIKYKFRNQKSDFIRNIQIALYIATFLPLLTIGLLAFFDNGTIAISTMIIYSIIYLFYILYKKHKVKEDLSTIVDKNSVEIIDENEDSIIEIKVDLNDE
ncbi:hypothetical protein DIC82_00255 [Clostridium beijerinckii]|nr:hypothetical protein DIC82_00255 [Clostridium beijerinckii]